MNTPNEETRKYICELTDFINDALDDYVGARNALYQAKERVINGLKEFGFSNTQACILAEGWCDAAYKSSTRKDI